jgi:hypothetical protein
MSYEANISIGGYNLAVNPERIQKRWMGPNFSRTVGRGMIAQYTGAEKAIISISGLAQSDIETIKKYVAARYNLTVIDYIPISERGERTRTVHEDISTETINGETVYLYVPEYTMAVVSYGETYEANGISYSIELEEM